MRIIPCIFKYFDEYPEWTKAYAFLEDNNLSKPQGSAYISLTSDKNNIKWYCFPFDQNIDKCAWIPDSPVVRELYEV
jgi:hypothetical protein